MRPLRQLPIVAAQWRFRYEIAGTDENGNQYGTISSFTAPPSNPVLGSLGPGDSATLKGGPIND